MESRKANREIDSDNVLSLNVSEINPSFRDIDFVKLIKSDPEVGFAIVSGEGRLLSHSENMPIVFGADPSRDYRGMKLDEIFFVKFANERNEFIQQAIQSNHPLRVEHLYQANRILSTIMPLVRENGTACAVVFSRRGKSDQDATKVQDATKLSAKSQYVDLGYLEALSKRELQVFILLGLGHGVPEAAKLLHRSPRTIEQHKASIGRKLGSSSIATLAKTVGRIGLTIDDLELERITALRPEFRSP